MRTQMQWSIIAAGMLAACSHTHADVVVLRADGSHASNSQATKTYNAQTGGWDIHLKALYAPGGVTSYTIRANGGEVIDNVWIDVPCWQNSEGNCIPAGSPVFVRLYSDGPNGLRSILNIEHIGTAETLLMHAEATHDIGSVTVQTIGTLIAGRDVIGPITGTTADNPYRGVEAVFAGRDVRGDVMATRGRVERIEAGRHIGSTFNPVTVRSKHSHMSIVAGNEVHGDFIAGFGGGPGYLATLSCQRLIGSVRTPQLGSTLKNGRVTIEQQFQGSLSIGGSLGDTVEYIQLPPNGLTGQIIINADNHPGGYWDAPIYLGPINDPGTIILTGPLYDLPSQVLGGGAIGVAPFRLHNQSCSPPNGSTVTVAPGSAAPTIALQHYGPIVWYFGTPVTVQRRPSGTEAPFSAVAASEFTMYRSEVNSTRLIVTNAPGRSGIQPGYDYRIQPTAQLRCDIPGEPPVQWQSDYVVSVAFPQCQGDLNFDNSVDVSDLLLLFAFWGPVAGVPQADINNDGVVDVSDLLLLLNNWGPCPVQQHAADGDRTSLDMSGMLRTERDRR